MARGCARQRNQVLDFTPDSDLQISKDGNLAVGVGFELLG